MSDFGKTSTTDDVLAGKDLTGKLVFITGGNSGLGLETGRAMASRGAHVVLAGRDQGKLDAAIATIMNEVSGAQLETILCDLGSLDAVRACGMQANARWDRIDLLINNAGVMACPFGHTADGFEMQFGTNHLGHFALTGHLMPLVRKGHDQRIVNLSSRGHHIAPVDFEDPHFKNRDYDKWQSYGQSKTANVLFTVGLEQRFADDGIHAIAVHPGGIQTNLGRHMSEDDMKWMRERMRKSAEKSGESGESGSDGFKTIPQGAATQCWAATADELEGRGGLYCEDCHVAEVDDENFTGGVRSYAVDPDNAERLWAMSEEMTGVSYG